MKLSWQLRINGGIHERTGCAGYWSGVVVELASGIEKVLEFLDGANPSAFIVFGLISLPNIKERVFCVTSYLSLILYNSSLILLHTVS